MDWHVANIAAQRVVNLLVELAGGAADEAGTDVGTAPDTVTVELPAAFASERIGIDFTEEQVVTSLEDLGAVVVKNDGGYTVTAPSWRNDLETKEDLSEEIARLVGYDQIPASLPVAPPGRGLTSAQQQRRRLVQALADSGLTEVLAYPFVSKAANDTFGVSTEGTPRKALKLANPISEEQGYLRTSILPGLIEVAKRNHSRGFRDVALFEAGLVFLPGNTLGTASIPPLGVKPGDEVLDGLYDGVPDQPLYVAAVLTGHDRRLPRPRPGVGLGRRPGHRQDRRRRARRRDRGQPREAPGVPPGTGCPAVTPHWRGPGLCRRAAPEVACRP